MSSGPTDTAPIRPEEQFDEQRVASYLRAALADLIGDAELTFDQFPGGAANLTYRAKAGDLELVLRRAPLGRVAKGGHDMEREHRVLARLWERFPFAPRAYHYCADPEIMGKPFFVMERRRGWVVRDTWPDVLATEPKRRRVAESLVDALSHLHAVDPASVGLEDLGRPVGFVSRQIAGWTDRWHAAKTRDVPAMDDAAAMLAASVPEPRAVAILHNDFKLDNTMVDATGSLVAVFDWDMATLGDPLVDLGTMLAYWSDPDGPTRQVFAGRMVPLTPHLDRAGVIDRYAARTGAALDDIGYYEGLAFFRLAVILEQIYARYVAGQTSDPRFAVFADAAPVLAEVAVARLREAGS